MFPVAAPALFELLLEIQRGIGGFTEVEKFHFPFRCAGDHERDIHERLAYQPSSVLMCSGLTTVTPHAAAIS